MNLKSIIFLPSKKMFLWQLYLYLQNMARSLIRVLLHQASASILQELCDDASNTPFIETMGTLHNGFAAHFQATPLFSMKVELLASSQGCHRVDALKILHWRILRRVRHPTPLSWYKHLIYMQFSGENWWNSGMALPSGKSWKLHFTAQFTKVILLSLIFQNYWSTVLHNCPLLAHLPLDHPLPLPKCSVFLG